MCLCNFGTLFGQCISMFIPCNLTVSWYPLQCSLFMFRLTLAVETMNIRYPQDKWLHIFTDGSQIDGHLNAGAGIYRELLSCYMPLGQHSTAFDGKIEAIRTARRLLNLHQDKSERSVIFSDSISAGSTHEVNG